MALAVDSADRLFREVFKVFSSIRDGLAIIGALYAAKKTLTVSWQGYKTIKSHVIPKVWHANIRQKYGTWAVVTGCTNGIGLAFSEQLALRGLNLVLISRSRTKLDEVAKRLESQYNIQVAVIEADFNRGEVVYDGIKKGLQGKDIGILVNNVGVMYDFPMYFTDVSQEKLWQLVNVNVAAATMMTHLVLPGMVERRRGAVITMASSAGLVPTPLITVYSATKAYLNYFCRALNHEYKKKGVTIQCLMPYFIATRMTQYSETLSKPSLLIPTADTYVTHALATLGWTDWTTGYFFHTIQLYLARMVPEWLYMWGGMQLNLALNKHARIRIRHRSGSKACSRPASSVLLSGSSSLDLLMNVPSSSSSEYVDAPSSM